MGGESIDLDDVLAAGNGASIQVAISLAKSGKWEEFAWFARRGLSLSKTVGKASMGETAWMLGDVGVIRGLLSDFPRLAEGIGGESGNPVTAAIRRGDMGVLGLAIGVSPWGVGKVGKVDALHLMSPLSEACSAGRMDMALALLDAGADADGSEDETYPPMFWAAARGQPDLVGLLAERGARTNWVVRCVHVLGSQSGAFVTGLLPRWVEDGHARLRGVMTMDNMSLLSMGIESGVDELVGMAIGWGANPLRPCDGGGGNGDALGFRDSPFWMAAAMGRGDLVGDFLSDDKPWLSGYAGGDRQGVLDKMLDMAIRLPMPDSQVMVALLEAGASPPADMGMFDTSPWGGESRTEGVAALEAALLSVGAGVSRCRAKSKTL